MNAPLVCSVCRRENCHDGSHSAPGRHFATAAQLDAETRSKYPRQALGHERAVIETCRSRIARLSVTDITQEARARALMALDELFDAYTLEREVESKAIAAAKDKNVLELFDELKASLAHRAHQGAAQ